MVRRHFDFEGHAPIKLPAAQLVKMKKLGRLIIMSGMFWGLGAWAAPTKHNADISQHEADTFPEPTPDQLLRDIDARAYEVSIKKVSSSNKTYLFEDLKSSKPGVGHIILLKQADQAVMAFRVLRTEIEKKIFFAKRVRRYGEFQKLEPGSTYTAIEKLNEVESVVPFDAQDQKDMRELSQGNLYGASGATGLEDQVGNEPMGTRVIPVDSDGNEFTDPQAVDAELDERPDQPRVEDLPDVEAGRSRDDMFDDDGGFDSSAYLGIDEIDPLDKLRNHLSGEFGFFSSTSPEGGSVYYNAMGIKYGITVGKMLLAKRRTTQDTLVLEGGMFLYRVTNYQIFGDNYIVMPLSLGMRYNIFASESLGFQFFGGIARSQVLSTSESTEEGVRTLSSIGPHLGAGLIFRLGPHWDARIEAGLDMIGGGLVLNF